MSTPYGIAASSTTRNFGGYVYSPVNGPLSHKFPNCIPKSYLGVLPTVKQTPQQFYPEQTPPDSNQNSNMRFQYRRTAISTTQRAQQFIAAKKSDPTAVWSPSTGNLYVTSTHTNYIEPIPCSMYCNIKKSIAVGKSAYGIGLPTDTPTSTKSYFPTEVRTHLRRVRNAGCVAPKKKGAIQNYSLSDGQTCAWGSIVRSTY